VPRAAAGLGAWLARQAPARARGDVAIALVSDAAMRRLNVGFRQVDRATDVLSFPAGDEGAWLGDIVIARGVAARQARREGHALRTELRILALHGLLHLLGYDHETDDGRMRRAEERLRRRAGLPVGLTARGEGQAARR
jgi:probable rRNA maturation factor